MPIRYRRESSEHSTHSKTMFHSSGFHQQHHSAAVAAAVDAINAGTQHRRGNSAFDAAASPGDWTSASPPPVESPAEFSPASPSFPSDVFGVAGEDDADWAADVDCLSALLSREVRDYSDPFPARYYPREFDEEACLASPSDKKKSNGREGSNNPIVGPWRRRIAGWMCDVLDHFKYDRDAAYVALHYVDRYVAHLLVERERISASGASTRTSGAGGPPVKRREFQLIAVTCLYLAIKLHGVLCEDLEKDEEEEEEEEEDEIEAARRGQSLSERITNLRCRQKRERMCGFRSGGSAHASVRSEQSPKKPLPYRPRKRGMLSGPLRLTSFVELSRGLFTARDIIATESKILNATEYKINPPTPSGVSIEMTRVLEGCMGVARNDHCRPPTAAREVDDAASAIMDARSRANLARAVRAAARTQAEAAAGSPALSMGTLPSVVAYAAVLNAVQDEFDGYFRRRVEENKETTADWRTNAGIGGEAKKKEGHYDLEDFQRHYCRFSRPQSAPPLPIMELQQRQPLHRQNQHQHYTNACDVQRQLDSWKEDFCNAIFIASDGALLPDDAEVREAREGLRIRTGTGEDGSQMEAQEPRVASPPSSNDERNAPSNTVTPPRGKKARSPRSPISVIAGVTSGMRRGSSPSKLFSRSSPSNNTVASSAEKSAASSHSETSSLRSRPYRCHQRQTSEPTSGNGDSNPRQFARTHAGPSDATMPAKVATTDVVSSRRQLQRGIPTNTTKESRGEIFRRWRSDSAFDPPTCFSV